MNYAEAFKKILSLKGLSQMELANRTDTRQGSIASMLYKGNPSLQVASRYLDACGYDVVLVPKGAHLPKDSFIVDEFSGGRDKK